MSPVKARCFCAAVEFEVLAEPVGSKLCHCAQCRRLHGAPFQWAVIFHKHHVRFTRGEDALDFFHADSGRNERILPCKLSCRHCHAPLADDGRRMFLAFGPAFDFGEPPAVPSAFAPRCHIFYGARVMDVNDNLPKYIGHERHSVLWTPSDGPPGS